MSRGLLLWAFTSSLAGFLFGFDTVVISGAEKVIQNLWQLSNALHGFAMASALWGTVVGSLVGAWPADRFGRKTTLIWIGVLYVVSAIWSALAPDVYSLIAARFVGGLGIGVCTVAAPMYIAEISPPKYRGRLTGMFQFNIVFGILVAFLSNALLAEFIEKNAWRWMLGVVGVPALIYSLLCFTLPESPRWLIARKRDRARGLEVLRKINPSATTEELNAIADDIAHWPEETDFSRSFWSRRLRQPIFLAVFIAIFNQLSGINAVLYFAPRIFQAAGLGEQASMLQSVGIGVTNLVFTFVGLWLIDHLGRRTLMYIGSIGYIVSLSACAAAFYWNMDSIVPICIFAFIAAHAVGQGAVIWVFISEIFPNRFRAAGQSLGSFTHWIFAALLTTFFPLMFSDDYQRYHLVFIIFAGMMVLQLLWVIFMMPETKGVPLEQVERKLGVLPE